MAGEKIRALRESLGMSQEQLAAQLQLLGIDIAQGTVSRIECGKPVLPDYELKYFAKFFNRPVEWFLEE